MNKLLISVYVPLLEEKYDVLIPINKKIGTVRNLIIDTIFELSGGNLKNVDSLKLYDKENGRNYDNDLYVKNSQIVNGTKLILL
jgi:hypothetical protein